MERKCEDVFIKPGNQDRGWNDPPQFSYGLQTSRGSQRSSLPRRAPPAGSGTLPMTPPTSTMTPPRSSPVTTPPIGSSVAPPPASGPITAPSDSVQSECEPDVEEVMSVLNAALEACSANTTPQVCVEMNKRLQILESFWKNDRLSSTVKKRMKRLCSDLESGLWDSADEAHRSLMVDHVTEVSQWMVGVKRLIAESRNLTSDPSPDPSPGT